MRVGATKAGRWGLSRGSVWEMRWICIPGWGNKGGRDFIEFTVLPRVAKANVCAANEIVPAAPDFCAHGHQCLRPGILWFNSSGGDVWCTHETGVCLSISYNPYCTRHLCLCQASAQQRTDEWVDWKPWRIFVSWSLQGFWPVGGIYNLAVHLLL